MLVIKTSQIQHFIADDDDELAGAVVDAVRNANGSRVAEFDDQELSQMARKGIERARNRGVTRAEDIAAFVAVMFEVAPRFDEQPEISEVLNDERFTIETRIQQLFDRVSDESWTDAEKKYEDSFWFDEP